MEYQYVGQIILLRFNIHNFHDTYQMFPQLKISVYLVLPVNSENCKNANHFLRFEIVNAMYLLHTILLHQEL